jgi:short-subunit dehydrogenase
MNELINANIASQLFMSKVLIPRLIARHELRGYKGAIINVASNQAYDIDPHTSMLAATKASQYTYGLGINQ